MKNIANITLYRLLMIKLAFNIRLQGQADHAEEGLLYQADWVNLTDRIILAV